jgi:hypothetical protein
MSEESETTIDKPKKKKKAKRAEGPARLERRFVPVAATNPWIVRALAGLAGLAAGAGAYGYLYGTADEHLFSKTGGLDEKYLQLPNFLIAGAAVLAGIAIWFGTSSESPVRVGDPGIAVERGEVRRMPWWAIEKITWQPGALALVVTGRDEESRDWTFRVPLRSHPDAVAWIVAEGKRRIPKKVSIEKAVIKKMPSPNEHAGVKISLEPLQVVGKKCAATGKTISYEPDARVCPQCERVYLKRSVPNKCKCGADIHSLRPAGVEAPEVVEEEEVEEDEVEEKEEEEKADKAEAEAET